MGNFHRQSDDASDPNFDLQRNQVVRAVIKEQLDDVVVLQAIVIEVTGGVDYCLKPFSHLIWRS